MSKHTPGPWVWRGEPGASVLGAPMGEVFAYALYEGIWPGRYNDVEDAANMRLVAQAPAMLDQLKLVAKAIREGHSVSLVTLQGVIDDAEGK